MRPPVAVFSVALSSLIVSLVCVFGCHCPRSPLERSDSQGKFSTFYPAWSCGAACRKNSLGSVRRIVAAVVISLLKYDGRRLLHCQLAAHMSCVVGQTCFLVAIVMSAAASNLSTSRTTASRSAIKSGAVVRPFLGHVIELLPRLHSDPILL